MVRKSGENTMNDLKIMSLIEQRDSLNERFNSLEEENQQLIETNADIFIKIQKRDAEIDNLVLTNKIIGNDKECFKLEIKRQKKEIQKRDELLAQAKIIIDSHQAVTLNPFKWDSCAQWLKQYEELKR